MVVWRLCHPAFAASAMTGTGSALTQGRWHRKGTHMVYTASSIALAMLEILVQSSDVPFPVAVIRVDVPDELIQDVDAATLPQGWDRDRRHAQPVGMAWFTSRDSVGLRVPSVVIPLENNLLLNPEHPAFSRVRHEWVDLLDIDARLRGARQTLLT